MKTLCLLGLALVCASALAAPARTQSTCSAPGLWCLFVDAGPCAVYCPPGTHCHVQGAYCAFGFGVDAVCECRPNPKINPI